MLREEEVRRQTGGAPGPGRARKRTGSPGGGPPRALSCLGPGWGPGWAGTAQPEAAFEASYRPAASGPRGGERRAGAARAFALFFPRAPLGRSRGARSRSERRAAGGGGSRAGGGGDQWWLVVVGVFGEG